MAVLMTGLVAFQLLALNPVLPALALGCVATTVLLIALGMGLRRPDLIAFSAIALLLLYALVLIGRTATSLASAAAPAIAGGLILSLQLGWWTIELGSPAHQPAAALWRRGAQIFASSLAGAGFAALLWQTSRLHPGASLVFVPVGILAVLGVVVVYLRIRSRLPAQVPREYPAQLLALESQLYQTRTAARSLPARLLALPGRWVRPENALGVSRQLAGRPRRIGLAGILLLADAVVTVLAIFSTHRRGVLDVSSISFSGTSNVAHVLAFSIVFAGAAVLATLTPYLTSAQGGYSFSKPARRSAGPSLAGTRAELDSIRSMCRQAENSGHPGRELVLYLDSIASRLTPGRLADGSAAVSAKSSLRQLDSLVRELERHADV
jgi:hypothetical protein